MEYLWLISTELYLFCGTMGDKVRLLFFSSPYYGDTISNRLLEQGPEIASFFQILHQLIFALLLFGEAHRLQYNAWNTYLFHRLSD